MAAASGHWQTEEPARRGGLAARQLLTERLKLVLQRLSDLTDEIMQPATN